jgi:hypothetical protein
MANLMGLQFQIVYKRGALNMVSDALSRVTHMMVIAVVYEVYPM